MSEANLKSPCSADLVQMSNTEILEAIRDMESCYKEHTSSAAQDHRRHLDRKENIFRLACRCIELRRIDRLSLIAPRSNAGFRSIPQQ